jgi:hypothetical protein
MILPRVVSLLPSSKSPAFEIDQQHCNWHDMQHAIMTTTDEHDFEYKTP